MVASGALRGKQADALNAIITHGEGTSAEIIRRQGLGANVNLWRARFTELSARGLIAEVTTRKCEITGRTAVVWEATDRSKPLDLRKGTGVSKKTLAATLLRICHLCEDAVGVIDEEGIDLDEEGTAIRDAIKEARGLAARA